MANLKIINRILPLFFFMALFPQQLEQFEVQITLADKGVTLPKTTKVMVSSPIPGLTFDSNRGIMRVEVLGNGKWKLTLEPGSQRFEIKADGYLAWSERFTFSAGKVYECSVQQKGRERLNLDETLFEITFQFNVGDVYASIDPFAPILTTGKLAIFKLEPAEYSFRFEKNGYQTYRQTISVKQDQVYAIQLTKDPERKVAFKPPGIITIDSNPQGAEVIINGRKLGNTPFSIDLTSGNHQLEIRKNLYYTDLTTFTLAPGETRSILRDLRPQFGTVTVRGVPDSAELFLDDKSVGSAPATALKLKSGSHRLSVKKALYHDYVEEFNLEDGQQKTFEYTLAPAFGTLELGTLPEDSAEVYLDGVYRGITPFHKDLPSGPYNIEVRKPYFQNTSETVVISDGLVTRRTLLMNSNAGTLEVDASGSDILINGSQSGTDHLEKRLLPGTYHIRAEKEKYYPEEKEVFLSVGETERIAFDLQPIQGSVAVIVNPPEAANAEIYLDDQPEGPAPQVLTLLIGEYTIGIQHKDFVPEKQSVLIKENQNQRLTFDLKTYSSQDDYSGGNSMINGTGECIDIDGNSYKTITIGKQEWMAENLKVTHYRNGDPIPTGFSNSEWANLSTGACAVYNNYPSNAGTYGNLYNRYAVDDDRGVCPDGWHVPTDTEWMELEMTLGMTYEEAHNTGWRGTNEGSQLAGNAELCTDGDLVNNEEFGSSGFTAHPGGYR
ncbi:MAG: PEGA domain-containing protein, partial [FCB group bacterium]|nr:PEGA domain-containing protein [FCB group bacterium]